MQSANLLLDRGQEAKATPSNQLLDSSLEKKSATTQHLETLTTSIITSFNAQDFTTPFTTLASPHYTYAHRHSTGEILHLDRSGAQTFVETLVKSKHPQHYADVLSLSTRVDEERGYANVWVSLRVSDGGEGRVGLRERVSVFSWRWEGMGTGKGWVWWTHACADDVPGVPF
ncbi:hypothetical protein M409DRAFT_24047 [Zasmidium cellare ATCC 36951]|uniref:SnoaL-like domain-containing protein n=1 Tax=Zasmidium cellare ATCC 36951 TaxID=1080233 RepID=A0A6A6CFB8_ZASCE|nr:uncharacterized protein M409DRAFT_24047 [Zasmidium cellare ATCC 36951]KAF2165761.1 hypothetical protein M409DRAFT_24047 [Zasmidium cellare ATCC 36951]